MNISWLSGPSHTCGFLYFFSPLPLKQPPMVPMNVVVIWRIGLDLCSCSEFDVSELNRDFLAGDVQACGGTCQNCSGPLSTLFEDRPAWGLIKFLTWRSAKWESICLQAAAAEKRVQSGGVIFLNEISVNHCRHFTVIWQQLTSWNPISQITLSNSSVSAEKQNALTMCELQRLMKMTVAAQCVFREELLLLQTPSGAHVARCPRDLVSSEDISNFTISVLTSAMLEDYWRKY